MSVHFSASVSSFRVFGIRPSSFFCSGIPSRRCGRGWMSTCSWESGIFRSQTRRPLSSTVHHYLSPSNCVVFSILPPDSGQCPTCKADRKEHRICFLPSYKWHPDRDAYDIRSQKHVPVRRPRPAWCPTVSAQTFWDAHEDSYHP